MNDKIRQLALQAGYSKDFLAIGLPNNMEKFAELIVGECVKECQREWYDLNNEKVESDMTPRDIGIKVGQKNSILKCISKIKQHFGVEE